MKQWESLIAQAGQKYNVDPQLISALVMTESSGNPKAYNASTGATGLAQQIPATAKSLGIDPTDPAQSIEGAAKLLDENLRRYGNAEQAILAYHGGTDQSNWGPKTQDYLRKVSANYGGQPMAANTPPADQALNEAFSARFGFVPGQKQSAAQAAPDYEAFQSRFGFVPGESAPAGPAQAVAQAQPAQTPPAQSGGFSVSDIPGMAWQGLQDLGAQGIANVNAAGRGISDVLDAPSEWLAAGAEKSGLAGLLGRAGVNMPTAAEQTAINAASRADYDARSGGGFQEGASRIAGNLAGVIAPTIGGEAALIQGGRALSGALGNPQSLAKAWEFLTGQGGIASRIGYNAMQGAAGGALLSGGQPDTSTAEAAGLGALLGGAVPIAGAAIKSGVGTARGLIDPFTSGGQTRVAQNILERTAGKGPTAADLTTYVPGSTPTLAQATGNPMLAALERQSINKNPVEFGAVKEQNDLARMAYLDSIRGDKATLADAIAVREAQAVPLLDQAMAGAKQVDPAPVVKVIDDILASPQGQRNSVKDALSAVRSKVGEGAKAQTDPGQLYGIRKSINDQLETVAGRDNTSAVQASKELIQVRNELDKVIESGAPGFKDYLTQYAELSKPVSAQKYLQGINFTDAQSQSILLGNVKKAINQIEKQRGKPGANDAKAITDDQLAALDNLHKDLQRAANSYTKGRSAGSNTAQNLAMDNLMASMVPGVGQRIPLGPEGIGGALGWALAGPAGGAMGAGAGNLLRQGFAAQNPAIEARLIDLLTDPATVLKRSNSGSGNNLLNRLAPAGSSTLPTASGQNNR